MAKKQKYVETKRLPTRQQLSKWERQKKLQRMILIAGCIFLAIIVAFVGYGYYDAKVKPFTQKVVKVNDAVIDMNYYLEWLDVFLKPTEATKAPLMAEMVLSNIVQNQIVLQRAPTLGVTIKDIDIENELTKLQLPVSRVYRDSYGAKALTDRLMAVYFDSRVPTTARQANIQAMFLESEDVAVDVLGKIINDNESFLQLAKRYSVEDFTKEKSGEIGWIVDGLTNVAGGKLSNSLLDDIAFSTAAGMISKPTYDPSVMKGGGYWLLEVIERDKDKGNHLRGILLGSENEAFEVKAKLNGGADFAAVVKEKSQHLESKEFGGDLGWVKKGYGSDIVVKVALEFPLKTLSDPLLDKSVRTKGGYWLAKVLERDDNRQLDKDVREQLKGKAFQDWVEEQGKSSTIERYLDDKSRAWAIEYTLKKLGGKKK